MIKKWMLKAAVQKGISWLPYRNRINLWFQKYITKGVQLNEEHLHWKLTHAKDHLQYLEKYSQVTAPYCLELGTGWYPIIPILLYLHGAQHIQTVDLNAHLSKATLGICLEALRAQKASGKLDLLFPEIQEKRWTILEQVRAQYENSSLEDSLAKLRIQAIVTDARHLSLPDHSLDFICSNNTFEHIYPEILTDILLEFKRVLKPDGIMSHFVDLSDHFAHFDRSINMYNFLRFSEKQWSRIDNSIQPQNRWRWPQYQALYQRLQIPIIEESVRPGDLSLLQEAPVHEEWKVYKDKELAISHGYLVSKGLE